MAFRESQAELTDPEATALARSPDLAGLATGARAKSASSSTIYIAGGGPLIFFARHLPFWSIHRSPCSAAATNGSIVGARRMAIGGTTVGTSQGPVTSPWSVVAIVRWDGLPLVDGPASGVGEPSFGHVVQPAIPGWPTARTWVLPIRCSRWNLRWNVPLRGKGEGRGMLAEMARRHKTICIPDSWGERGTCRSRVKPSQRRPIRGDGVECRAARPEEGTMAQFQTNGPGAFTPRKGRKISIHESRES
jgi:hypothetical protein